MTTYESSIATRDESVELPIPSIATSKSHNLQLEEDISSLFREGKRERFESGYESNFARQIRYMIDSHSEQAINIIASLILAETANPDVADEALRWIGNMRKPDTHLARRRLLELCLLQSDNLFVRDGAGLGLASMDDPDALPAVKAAIENEHNLELKGDLQQVYDQLIETQLERAK